MLMSGGGRMDKRALLTQPDLVPVSLVSCSWFSKRTMILDCSSPGMVAWEPGRGFVWLYRVQGSHLPHLNPLASHPGACLGEPADMEIHLQSRAFCVF